jgi:hypothetical protein
LLSDPLHTGKCPTRLLAQRIELPPVVEDEEVL